VGTAPEAWGVADICDALGVTRLTVLRWRERADFPPASYVNRGKTAIWDPHAVLEWTAHNAGASHARTAAGKALADRRHAHPPRPASRD